MRKTSVLFLCLSLVMLLSIVSGQNYVVKDYDFRTGLPHWSVLDIVQSDNGKMWIATPIGVYYYNGTEWNRPNELFDNAAQYQKFVKSENGTIWAMPLFLNKSVLALRSGKWEAIPVSNFSVENDDMIVFNEDGTEKILTLSTSGKAFLFDGQWKDLGPSREAAYEKINSFFTNNDKVYACSDVGILKYNNGKFSPSMDFKILPADFKIRYVFVYPDAIYFFSDTQFGELKNNEFKILGKNLSLRTRESHSNTVMAREDPGTIFFGNNEVFYYYSEKTGRTEKLVNYIKEINRGGYGIEIDYEKNIWIASGRGLKKIRRIPFENFRTDKEVYNNEISAIGINSAGKIFLGQTGGLAILYKSDLKKIVFRDRGIPSEVFSRVMDIEIDQKDRTWIVAFRAGLGLVENNSVKWIYRQDTLEFNSLAISNDGSIFLGASSGLYKYSDTGLELVSEKLKHHFRKIKLLKDGSLAGCTNGQGIYFYKDGLISNVRSDNVANNSVYSIFEHSLFGLLIGTAEGLCRIENNKIVKFEHDGFQIRWPVYFIHESSDGYTWLGTQNGVVKWNGSDYAVYNSSNGLPGDETNRAAVAEDIDGRVWIGTTGGATCFEANYPVPKINEPKGELLSIESSDGKEYINFSNLEFEPGLSLIFNMQAFTYIDETKIKYITSLCDNNGNLIDSTSSVIPNLRYPSLQPGNYIWKMYIENSVGVKSGVIRSVNFKVLVPFFETDTFKMLAVLAGLIFILAGYYNITRIRRTKKLEDLVDRRTKELNKNLEAKLQVEKELIESENTLKMLTDSTHEGIAIHEQGVLILVNRQLTEMFGYSEEEFIGSNSKKYFSEDSQKIILEKMYSESKECYRVLGLKKSGATFPVEMRSHSIIYKNRKVRVAAVRDITERVRFEEELLYKNRLEKILSGISSNFINIEAEHIEDQITIALSKICNLVNADAGYLVSFDEKKEYLSMSNIWQNQNLNISLGELRSLPIEKMPWWCNQILNSQPVIINNVEDLEGQASFQKTILQSKGIAASLDIPIIFEREVAGVIGFFSAKPHRDWNEDEKTILSMAGQIFFNAIQRREANNQIIEAKEKAVASDRLKTEFLAQMSHEIRSPINVLLNYLSLIDEMVGEDKDFEMQTCFDGVDSAGRRIIRTIDLILNVSELQRGLYDSRPRNLDLIEIIKTLVLENKSSALRKKLELEIISDLNSAIVSADEYSLTQILANLIDNAIKYTERGGVAVKIYRENGDCLITEVTDTGIGIAEDFLDNLFDPFSQEQQGYSRRYEGNGLGLTLVKKYCELNEAEVEVESKKNVGTTFRIKFNNQNN